MIGTYCRQTGKFERGQMFRRYCIGCVHNTTHLGDEKLYCRYLEYRITYHPKKGGEVIPNTKPSIRIPPDLR